MIVDCHTHINCPSRDIDTAEHLEACEKVDACIVLASGQSGSTEANKEISKYVKGHRKMVGFAVVNPVEDKIATRNMAW